MTYLQTVVFLLAFWTSPIGSVVLVHEVLLLNQRILSTRVQVPKKAFAFWSRMTFSLKNGVSKGTSSTW